LRESTEKTKKVLLFKSIWFGWVEELQSTA